MTTLSHIHWEYPAVLWLLLPLVVLGAVRFLGGMLKRAKPWGVLHPSLQGLSSLPRSFAPLLGRLGFWSRWIALVMLVFAAARPQILDERKRRTNEGLDIMMVLDTSVSMAARDFLWEGDHPTRLDVVKIVTSRFIDGRPNDRIGLVVFGSDAFTQAPLTYDHQVLGSLLKRIQVGMAGDATAIGDGLAVAIKRLRELKVKSKVLILLTDGTNTAGRLDPLASTAAARELGIRIYTIAVGQDGEAPIEINGRMQTMRMDVDEELLQKIAQETGGKFWSATDTETLVNIYATIDRLEKTAGEAPEGKVREELFSMFTWLALIAVSFECLWRASRWRRIPAW